MRTFKEYLAEHMVCEISSNDAGVLHELLVGHKLNGNKHMNDEAKAKHDEILSRLSETEYKHAQALAHTAANKIQEHAKSLGHVIHSVHWTSKPGDIGKVTGEHNAETQQENPSDIMIRTDAGHHVGYSLKVTSKKNGKVPVGNPGVGQTDKQLGTSTGHHYEAARRQLEEKYPHLKGMTDGQRKVAIRADDNIKNDAKKFSTQAISKIRDEWHSKLSSMPTDQLAHHIRHNLLHANATKTPMYKVVTGGSETDNSSKISHPHTEHDHILNDHKNITVHTSGNSIIFKHNGKQFMRHRLKPMSEHLASTLKGSIE